MSARALFVMPLALAACDVGEVPLANTSTDGGTVTGDGGTTAALCQARLTPANQGHSHAGGTYHQGENCLKGGCHLAGNLGTGAPAFDFGGTLYGIDGTTANKGATMHFTNSAGAAQDTTSDDHGNFYLEAGALANAFPAHVSASVCATGSTTTPPAPMNTALATIDGGCARSTCHVTGAQGAVKLDPAL